MDTSSPSARYPPFKISRLLTPVQLLSGKIFGSTARHKEAPHQGQNASTVTRHHSMG
ncbi:MAG: hypothetical protein ACPGPG_03105 [Luminiphilus sp.]|jgi:hypothetical protein